jgi:pyruvate ferredoxin oxidoreductase beta subunit
MMYEVKSIRDVPGVSYVTGGAGTCAGCPGILGLRMALKVLGKNTILVNASGCMTLLCNYPKTPLKVSWLHNAIENAGSSATGVYRALRRLGIEKNMNVLCYAGDGATYDIGLQSLSGAVARKEDFAYICYNNQSYGNTGVQCASSTPYGAKTKTTPEGNPLEKKNMPKIIASHGDYVYVATASLAYPLDYMRKVQRAARHKGPGYVELLAPCPPGWLFDASKTIEVSKKAVETAAWPLYEIKEGVLNMSHIPNKIKPIEEYLSMQGRFKGLSGRVVKKIQESTFKEWEWLMRHNKKEVC